MATHTYTEPVARRDMVRARSIAQAIAVLFSLAFIVIGVAGFIPSLTTQSADLANSGPASHSMLFDLFQVSVLHNVVHIALGVIGLMAASGPRMARLFLIVGGLAYLGLAAWGFMVDMASKDNFLPVNTNDNWLHVGLGAAMVILGLLSLRAGERTRTSTSFDTGT